LLGLVFAGGLVTCPSELYGPKQQSGQRKEILRTTELRDGFRCQVCEATFFGRRVRSAASARPCATAWQTACGDIVSTRSCGRPGCRGSRSSAR
jgi:hypothetical protein